jgi:hypothetical protein
MHEGMGRRRRDTQKYFENFAFFPDFLIFEIPKEGNFDAIFEALPVVGFQKFKVCMKVEG